MYKDKNATVQIQYVVIVQLPCSINFDCVLCLRHAAFHLIKDFSVLLYFQIAESAKGNLLFRFTF